MQAWKYTHQRTNRQAEFENGIGAACTSSCISLTAAANNVSPGSTLPPKPLYLFAGMSRGLSKINGIVRGSSNHSYHTWRQNTHKRQSHALTRVKNQTSAPPKPRFFIPSRIIFVSVLRNSKSVHIFAAGIALIAIVCVVVMQWFFFACMPWAWAVQQKKGKRAHPIV
jgi:hypothetical protein